MNTIQLVSISIFTMALVFTFYRWMDRHTNEGFDNSAILSDEAIAKLKVANAPMPTDKDASEAHRTLLQYTQNDFSKGMRFIQDFGKRFYGDNLPFRQDLDTRTLMDNYVSP